MSLNRRQFVCISLGAGAAGGLGATAWRWSAPASPAQDASWQTASRTARALGSEVSITAVHPRVEVAERGLDAAFDALAQVEELMSIYRPDSQLSRLNREGVLRDPHPHLLAVLRHAQQLSHRTAGAFDVTVQPLWSLYAEAARNGELPRREAVERARGQVDWRQVFVSNREIRLAGKGTAITLNGIAQGYAADAAMCALREAGVTSALVNTGEIGALGAKQDGRPWTIGIQHPRREDAFVSLTKLAGRCLATSGDYATAFSEDLRFNHVFDPRTGQSPESLASVSVAAPSAMAADALSTAIFVLGPEKGIELIQSSPRTDVLLVLKNGRTMGTPGFPIAVG